MNERLEYLREEKDLLKKDVAKILGVVDSVYTEWENEKLAIPTRRLYQIANYYEVNIDYIVGLTEKRIKLKSKNDIDIKIVSTRLREVRKSLNFTMRELASKLNTTSSVISNYENEKYLILSTFLIELCKISNYSMDYILGRTDVKILNSLE